MIGLIILLVAGTYLALWIAVVLFSYRRALHKGYSKKKAFAVGGFFFLVMYLIPFWDLIPTLVTHKYYCNTQAGLTVYKTPEEWAKENPGVLEALEAYEKPIDINLSMGRVSQKNDRFGSLFERYKVGNFSVRSVHWKIIDVNTGEIVVEDMDFMSGYGSFSLGYEGWWKFWLLRNSCYSDSDKMKIGQKMDDFYKKFIMTWR